MDLQNNSIDNHGDAAGKPAMSMKQRLLSCGLVLVCVFLAFALTVFIAVSAVVLESHTYKRAARQEAYLAGIEAAVAEIMEDSANEMEIPENLLTKHAKADDIRKLAKQNAADSALVLKGSQVIYGHSFDKAALQTEIYKFREKELPAEEPADEAQEDSTSDAVAEDETAEGQDDVSVAEDETVKDKDDASATEGEAAEDLTPQQKAEEDPVRKALREECDNLASKISVKIDSAVRVIDMEQLVYDSSNETLIDWLRFMGRGGILLPLLLLGVALLALYRQTWERGFSPWLTGVSICSGAACLIPAIVILINGWLNQSVEPVQLAILYETILQGILAELILMAALWFVIGYIALRAAMGRPVSTKKLRALIDRLRKKSSAASETNAPASDGELLEIIKKAAADSTNSLLGRKRR